MRNSILRHQLLLLIQAELWNKPLDEALFVDCRWDELMQLAKEQTVFGLVMQGKRTLPQELQPERRANLRWLGSAGKIQMNNERMNKAVVAITGLYKKMGVNPLIMKGQVIATEYPHPDYRHSGDIDICFRSEKEARQAYKWVETSEECKCLPLVNEKEQPFSWHGIAIENHERVVDMAYGRYQTAIQKIFGDSLANDERCYVEICGNKIETLPCTLALFHLIVHMEYHILNEGIGLRQFCDIAVYTSNHADELNRDSTRLNSWLKECGLDRIAAAIGWILIRELGVGESMIAWNLEPNGISKQQLTDAADMIMNDLWTGGNFGKKKWAFKKDAGFLAQKLRAMPLHWAQYRKYREILPNEAWANFIHKFYRASKGVK